MLMMWKIQQAMQDDEVRSCPPNTKEKRPLLAGKASPPSHMNNENFTKNLEVRRDLGNRAYAKRPLEGLQCTRGGKRAGVGGGGGAELTLTHIFLILTDRRVLN